MADDAGLWPYQQRGLDEIRATFLSGARAVLYVAPTGSGKTVLFTNLVDGTMRRGKRCVIIAHRIEIVEQVSTALAGLGVPHGAIAPGFPETPELVQVASIALLVRRIDRHDHYDLIVTDEAHHSVAGSWRRVIEAMPRARLLGCTATPERLDGRGLRDVFQTMVIGPTTAELIEAGYLSKFTAYAPVEAPDMTGISTRAGDFDVAELAGIMARPVIVGSAVDSYEKLCPGKRAIAYGVDRRHKSDMPRLRHCEHCDAINPPKAPTCSACGADLRPTPQEQREIEAELRRVEHLRRIEALRGMRYGEALKWAGSDESKLHQVAAARGYRRGWVFYRLQELRGGQ